MGSCGSSSDCFAVVGQRLTVPPPFSCFKRGLEVFCDCGPLSTYPAEISPPTRRVYTRAQCHDGFAGMSLVNSKWTTDVSGEE